VKQVHERIFVGNDADCRVAQRADLTIAHGCKTCHQAELKYFGKLLPTDINYLAVERDNNLFMNLIDPPVPLFKLESFVKFLQWSGAHYAAGESMLIHCNQGQSRAPSLALVFLSKKLGVIGNGSYARARADFESLYPTYAPGKGIETFLTQHWQEI